MKFKFFIYFTIKQLSYKKIIFFLNIYAYIYFYYFYLDIKLILKNESLGFGLTH